MCLSNIIRMVQRTFAIYENEISECILYCFCDIVDTLGKEWMYTFLTSQFDVLPVVRETDVRTTFILAVSFDDDENMEHLELKQNITPEETNIGGFSNRIKGECKSSVLGQLVLGNKTISSELSKTYLSVLKDLYKPTTPFRDLVHTDKFPELALPFFYLAHGIATVEPKPNILYVPAADLKGLIHITIDVSNIQGE